MKLEKYKTGKKKKVTVISSIILVFILMLGIIIYESYALYEDKKTFNVLNGTVPLFGSTTGSVELAYTVDGQAKTDPFPTKESKYIAKNVTCENGVEANWNNMEWGLIITNSNNKEKVKCTIDFTKKKIEVYGIERSLSSTSSAWTRTNDAVGKVANAQIGESAVRNDFDGIYPWSEINSYNYNTSTKQITAWYYGSDGFKFDGSKGEVLTYIPEFYYQRYQDGTKEYIQISKEYIEGFTKSEAFSVGRYTMSGSASGVHSKSGVKPFVNTNITNYRTYARNLGSGFGQMDYHYFLIQLLYLVEYADYDIQAKVGLGVTNSSNTESLTSGGCDALGMKSGTLNNDGKHSVVYRGMEDIYGNIFQLIDGINIKDRTAYICYDQSKYATDTFTGCYKAVGYRNSANGCWITKIGYDRNNSLVSFPVTAEDNDNSYIYDYYISNLGDTICGVGGKWSDQSRAGLWYMACNNGSSLAKVHIGSRLIKLN